MGEKLMGCIVQNETCAVCGLKIGKEQKICIYVGGKGYMHETCNQKWRLEQIEIEEKKV